MHNLLEDPTVLNVAERRSKTPAQIILRYLVQLGMVVIPKSSKRDRIVENFSIFDFVLDPEDMAALGGLDKVDQKDNANRLEMQYKRIPTAFSETLTLLAPTHLTCVH